MQRPPLARPMYIDSCRPIALPPALQLHHSTRSYLRSPTLNSWLPPSLFESQELNDKFKGEETDPNEKDPKRAQFRRACLVISGAEGIGLAPLIRANHITGKAHLYNIAFVAQLLNRRPRIHRESLHLDASIKMQVSQGYLHGTAPVSISHVCVLLRSAPTKDRLHGRVLVRCEMVFDKLCPVRCFPGPTRHFQCRITILAYKPVEFNRDRQHKDCT